MSRFFNKLKTVADDLNGSVSQPRGSTTPQRPDANATTVLPQRESASEQSQQLKEGFICPICMTSFAGQEALQCHFAASHTNEPTNLSAADIFGVAFDNPPSEVDNGSIRSPLVDTHTPDQVSLYKPTSDGGSAAPVGGVDDEATLLYNAQVENNGLLRMENDRLQRMLDSLRKEKLTVEHRNEELRELNDELNESRRSLAATLTRLTDDRVPQLTARVQALCHRLNLDIPATGTDTDREPADAALDFVDAALQRFDLKHTTTVDEAARETRRRQDELATMRAKLADDGRRRDSLEQQLLKADEKLRELESKSRGTEEQLRDALRDKVALKRSVARVTAELDRAKTHMNTLLQEQREGRENNQDENDVKHISEASSEENEGVRNGDPPTVETEQNSREACENNNAENKLADIDETSRDSAGDAALKEYVAELEARLKDALDDVTKARQRVDEIATESDREIEASKERETDVAKRLEAESARVVALETELASARDTIARQKEEASLNMKQFEDRLQSDTNRLKAEAENSRQAMRKECDRLEVETRRARDEVAELTERLADTTQSMQRANDDLARYTEENERVNAQLKALGEAVATHDAEKRSMVAAEHAARDDLAAARSAITDLERRVDEGEQELTAARVDAERQRREETARRDEEAAALTEAVRVAKADTATIAATAQSTALELVDVSRRLEEATASVARLEGDRDSLQRSAAEAEKRARTAVDEVEAIRRRINELSKEKLTADEELAKLRDAIEGERLEMGLRNEAITDENKLLADRLLAAESERRRLADCVDRLEAKLRDGEQALCDMALQHQALQRAAVADAERRWQENADTPSCSLCDRAFSLTVRRHHCRRCGRIFCAGCSSKTARLAAHKDAVRVCETCFHDVGASTASTTTVLPPANLNGNGNVRNNLSSVSVQ